MNTAHTDCYKLLGIASDAEPKVIQKAWRLKTKEIHPDPLLRLQIFERSH